MKTPESKVFDPSREQVFTVQDQGVRDPITGQPGGVMPSYDISAGAVAHPWIRYDHPRHGDIILEADVHLDNGGKPYILLYCPNCRHTLTIFQGNKPFLHRADKFKSLGGEISVERFECTNDLRPGERCGFRGVIERNILRRL